jgi:hypothetical protein
LFLSSSLLPPWLLLPLLFIRILVISLLWNHGKFYLRCNHLVREGIPTRSLEIIWQIPCWLRARPEGALTCPPADFWSCLWW